MFFWISVLILSAISWVLGILLQIIPMMIWFILGVFLPADRAQRIYRKILLAPYRWVESLLWRIARC